MNDQPNGGPDLSAFDKMLDTDVQATPAEPPAQTEPSSTPPAAESDIRDPAAYYKAQSEKLERLLKKAEASMQPPPTETKPPATTQPTTPDDLVQRIAQLEQLLDETVRETKAERVARLRNEALDGLGLTGESRTAAEKMLTATTADGIQQQAANLKALLPTPTSKIGNSGQAPQGEPNWLRQFRADTEPNLDVFNPTFHKAANGGIMTIKGGNQE